MSVPEFGLTEEEKHELHARPVPTEPATEEQLLMRQAIAKKFWEMCLRDDPTLSPEFRAIYAQYPMWKFYTNKEQLHSIARRSYGVAVNANGDPVLHMVSCHLLFVNDVIGGVPCAEVFPLDKWSPAHVGFIKLALSSPEQLYLRNTFLDPLGFLCHIADHNRS